jgi:hypothetical protein
MIYTPYLLSVVSRYLYNILILVQYYLPKYEQCPVRFLRDILSKKKLVSKISAYYYLEI